MQKIQVVAAHRHSSRHRSELQASECCGCCCCRALFVPAEIERWLNEGDGTALCPVCGIDAVIGSASGYPITDDFLAAMQQYWFTPPICGQEPASNKLD